MKFPWFAVLAVAGCAKGSTSLSGSDAPPGTPDAPAIDAPMTDTPMIDTPPPIDAMIDAPIDAMIDAPIDAMADAMVDAACVPMTSQLLANPALDLTPMGTGWQQTVIDAGYPLITDQDGPAEHSAPYKAWLGGFVAPTAGTSVTDVLWQDFAVPANTTQLVLHYYVLVGTAESTTATTAYDTGSVAITNTSGTVIANVAAYSNLTPVAAWTQVTFTVPQNLSGQTVRLRLTSSNDDSFNSNFFFDSFTLDATHCP